MRTTFDFSPLFRHSVGFDRMQQLLDNVSQSDGQAPSYPPYNIEVTSEDGYRITMAVAGFSPEDLDVTVTENTLVISGHTKKDSEGTVYLHRGIAGRSFERRFELAEHVRVASAHLVNGLLHVELAREIPEEKKPRTIAIQSGATEKTIESKAA